jgi:hypothetical protein
MCEGTQDNEVNQEMLVQRTATLVKSILTRDSEMMDPIPLNSSCPRRMQPCPRIKEIFRYNNQITVSVEVQSDFRFLVDLENALDLLESNSFLEQDLGIASLSFLSDPMQVPKGIAQTLAYGLIYRLSSDVSSTLGDRIQNSFEDYVYSLQVTNHQSLSQFHFLRPLITLINGLEIILDDGEATIVEIWSEESPNMLCVFWRHILQFLIMVLGLFQKCPHSAALAAKCIRLIIEVDYDMDDRLLSEYDDFPLLVFDAYEYGKHYNVQLEQESLSLQNVLVNEELW